MRRKVLRSFNTWTFKREQPSDPQLLLRVVAEAIAAQKPVPFLLYWGKGPRHDVASPDLQCLDFLAALAERVRGAYTPGAAIKLILTDTHAELNGHTVQNIERYYDGIRLEAQRRGFDTCLLGQLVKSAGNLATAAPLDEVVSAETAGKPHRQCAEMVSRRRHAAGRRAGLSADEFDRATRRRTGISRFDLCHLQRQPAAPLFPRQLPIFYMYSLRRGIGVKPWFMSGETTTARLGATRRKRWRIY